MTELKKANFVLAACVLFNLSIGVLYAWSVLTSHLTAPVADGGFGWTASQAGLPYSIAIVTFALSVVIGGRIQDKIGPRWVLTAGGLLMGLGLVLVGVVGNTVLGVVLLFGVLASTGMGFGYACVTAPALKWFHPSKKGLISGLIVGGFGLSAVFMAPFASALLENLGIAWTFIILGIVNLCITTLIAQFVKNPPDGYTPHVPAQVKTAKSAPAVNHDWAYMLKTGRFYMIFLIFVLTSSVGLMIIGNLTRIARSQAGITDAAVLAGLVAFLALMNTLGRVAGGIMSDKIGRINALFVILGLQTVNMAVFALFTNLPLLVLGLIIVGFCFGALLSVMPALCADLYGLKHFGINYGLLFLAWGLSGVITPVIASYFYDVRGSFTIAYAICAVMMALMIGVNVVLKRMHA